MIISTHIPAAVLIVAILISTLLSSGFGVPMTTNVGDSSGYRQSVKRSTKEAQNSEDGSLRASFGKSSHVLIAVVTEATVHNRSGEKLEKLPETLARRQYLELTLHVIRVIAPLNEKLPEQIPLRLEAPGLEIYPFIYGLTRAKKVFLLKKDLQSPANEYYYPSDAVLFFTGKEKADELQRWESRRVANTPKPPEGAKAYYRVPGAVPRILQDGGFDCWAAAAAMMLSWRDQSEYTKEQAARLAGETFVRLLATKSSNAGLEPSAKREFLTRIGLVAENPQTFTPRGLRDLLREHGPLWVTVNIGGEDDPDFLLPHARVVIAIDGNGSPDGTFLTYLDPDPDAERQRESVQDFTREFEFVARQDLRTAPGSERQPFRPQILHF